MDRMISKSRQTVVSYQTKPSNKTEIKSSKKELNVSEII